MLPYKTYKQSEQGITRSSNQDSCAVYEVTDKLLFLAVADGMGGYKGGKIASSMVLEVAAKILVDKVNHEHEFNLKELLQRIFSESDLAIREMGSQKDELRGMGTTLSCVLVNDDRYVWGNIGDSRIYLYSDNKFRLISKDHSYLQQYIDQFGSHHLPNDILAKGNVLTRAINGEGDKPDIFPDDNEYARLKDGDVFLICSDGLIPEKLNDYARVFEEHLNGYGTIEEAARHLVEYAEAMGSTDDISIVMAGFGAYRKQPAPEAKPVPAPSERIADPSDHFSYIDPPKPRKSIFKYGMAGLLAVFIFLLFYVLFPGFTQKLFSFLPGAKKHEVVAPVIISWDEDANDKEKISNLMYSVMFIDKDGEDVVLESGLVTNTLSLTGDLLKKINNRGKEPIDTNRIWIRVEYEIRNVNINRDSISN